MYKMPLTFLGTLRISPATVSALFQSIVFFAGRRLSSKYNFSLAKLLCLNSQQSPRCSNQNSIASNVLLRPPCLVSPWLPVSLVTMLILGLHTSLKMLVPIEAKQNKSNFPCEAQLHFSAPAGSGTLWKLWPGPLSTVPLLTTVFGTSMCPSSKMNPWCVSSPCLLLLDKSRCHFMLTSSFWSLRLELWRMCD